MSSRPYPGGHQYGAPFGQGRHATRPYPSGQTVARRACLLAAARRSFRPGTARHPTVSRPKQHGATVGQGRQPDRIPATEARRAFRPGTARHPTVSRRTSARRVCRPATPSHCARARIVRPGRWAIARTRSAIAVSGRGVLRANQLLTPCRAYRGQMTHHSMSVSARRLISTTRCRPVWPKVRSMTLHSREIVNKCGKRESRCQGR